MTDVDDFVHLHLHGDMSQLDGACKIGDYVKKATERGHKAIGLTDHGTMRGIYNLMEETKGAKIKPLFGIEFYVCNDMGRRGITQEERSDVTKGLKKPEFKEAVKSYEEMQGFRDRWHTECWAADNVGLKNLFQLSSKSWIEGFYYKPRVDIDALCEHAEGVFLATGCLSSPINDNFLRGREKVALEIADRLYEAYGDRLWLEIQPHNIPEQRQVNRFIVEELKPRYKDCGLLATQDAHYLERSHAEHHEVLLCIGTNDKLSNPKRFKFDGNEFHFRTRDEMEEAFRQHHPDIPEWAVKESLDNTVVLAERSTAKIVADYHKALVPEVDLPEEVGGDGFTHLKNLCIKGWNFREIRQRAARLAKLEGKSEDEMISAYKERLKKELGAIKRQKFVSYFLLVHDLYGWARGQQIACGPGRGSAAGSLVAFLLGITSVDPLEHKLIFERFISPQRIDLPDIDMDFEDVRRQEIIDHLVERWGRDKVAQIATMNKLSGKECIKSVSRVLEVPFPEVNAVTNSIIERSSGDERASQTIEDSFKDFKVCRDFNEKYPLVLHHARRLEGMTKGLGIHAAGVVTSPVPLADIIPLETRTKPDGSRVVVTAFEMYGVGAMGLVKLDVLGLRTMTVLRMAKEKIFERHKVAVDFESMPLDDQKVLDGFTAHDYVGIFQYDSPGADKVCAGVNFVHFEDVAAMTALNRPGTARSGLATQYVERKKNPELVKESSFHPAVSEITKDTLGIIVYQEHVLRIFTDIAGFEPATADSLRKTIAKKIGNETLGKERENFIKGAMKHTPGMTEKIAGKIMDAITFFGSYGFNKSHATSYAMIAYWGMWLKTYYPLEFYWALLSNEPTRERVQTFAKDAKKHGVPILPPDVNISRNNFTVDENAKAIRGSLVDIKNVGDGGCSSIVEGAPYRGPIDFLKRINRRKVNKRVILSLAKAGALKSIIPNTKWFIESIDIVWKTMDRKNWEELLPALFEKARGYEDYSEEEMAFESSKVNPLAFGKHPMNAYDDFLKSLPIEVELMGGATDDEESDFFKNGDRPVYIAGIVVEVKYNQIGDFHTGEMPSEEEREKMGWGKRYANVNVEDSSGKQNRIKVDWHIFDEFREVVDAGVGTPVLVHAAVNSKYENLAAHFIIDLEAMRQKMKNKLGLTIWENVVTGHHPAKMYPWKDAETKKRALRNIALIPKERRALVTGLVSNLKTKKDKRGNEMAFFGLFGVKGYVDVICFGSNWPDYAGAISPGEMITVELKTPNGRKDPYILEDGRLIRHRKSSALAKVG